MRIKLLIWFGILISTTLPLNAQTFEESIALASKKVEMAMDSQLLPGIAVSVYADGKMWSDGFGYSNLESKSPIIPEISRFRIGSISKTLTAAALSRLYEDGAIDLDANVDQYYTGFPDKGNPITIKQLAGHLSGIRHYQGNEFLNSKRYENVQDGLSIFKDSPLLFAPGEKYSYSYYGYNLLSAVIEQVSKMLFLQYMQDQVFSPLEMLHTVPDYPEKIIPGRVEFYERKGDVFLNAPFVDNSYKWAGGGFLSTSTDLMLFARAHLDYTFVSEETFDTFTASQKTNAGEETGYGVGWRTANDRFGRHYVGHSGGSVGGTSMLMIYPAEKVIVILLVNCTQANIGNLASEIANDFIK
ncbi:MAG: beta-lactamase family protein [Saprospiraceae bacterium]|nr:beta-lactamase family protein [Saprospiraceae bacterium]